MPFNDSKTTVFSQQQFAKQLSVWHDSTNNRIPAIQMTLDSGELSLHGKTALPGLTFQRRQLNLTGNPLVGMEASYGFDPLTSTNVIFTLKFIHDQGNVEAIGNPSAESNYCTFALPSGYQIVGFFGREGHFIDSIGVIASPNY